MVQAPPRPWSWEWVGANAQAQGSGLRAQVQGSGTRLKLRALARTVRVPARLALVAAVGAEVDGAHALERVEREETGDDGIRRCGGGQSEGDPVAQPA